MRCDRRLFVSRSLAVAGAYFVPAVKVRVGIMCAAPEGPGFEATFRDLKLDNA
jgi:regulation of enolase protein 1 (concanavalin A-like superfamily)